jgi:hypothetical protein
MQRLAADPPVAAVDLLDDDPGDTSHVLALDRDHRVGQRSTICPFCSGVNTSSISLTLMSGIRSSFCWVVVWLVAGRARRLAINCGTLGRTRRGVRRSAEAVTVSFAPQVVDVLAGGEVGDGAGGHSFPRFVSIDVPQSYE